MAFFRPTLAIVFCLATRSAHAACVMHGARPTVPLPTSEHGQQFSFIASNDCATLRFVVPDSSVSKIPKPGLDAGPRDRTYKVVLSDSEWNSVVNDGDTSFTWTIIGKTSAGVTTRLTTTNELEVEPAVVELSSSDADAKISGTTAGGSAGSTVASAGDVDGNGVGDLLVGEWYGNAVYLFPGPVSTTTTSGAGATLTGGSYDCVGSGPSAGIGDQNADGFDDLVVTEFCGPSYTYQGRAYVVLGPISGSAALATAAAATITGEDAPAYFGFSTASGDVNGDLVPDLVVGAPYSDASYVFFGPVTTGSLVTSDADVSVLGGSETWTGGVNAVGDVDGDGFDDLITSAEYTDLAERDAGIAYLFIGRGTGSYSVEDADTVFAGSTESSALGSSLSMGGDIDGDGLADIIIGEGVAYTWTGSVFVFSSSSLSAIDSFEVTDADATIESDQIADGFGVSIDSTGDVNSDDIQDLVIGAWYADGYDGRALGFYGPVSGTMDPIDASFAIQGGSTELLGGAVAFVGDVTGDGGDALAVGAPNAAAGSTYAAGAVYVFAGGGF